METKKGIDVSVWQKNINWDKVKDEIDFAILRIGYTSYGKSKPKKIDSTFEDKYAKCKALGIPVGVYWYSCAVTEEEAIVEANKVLEILKGRKLEYPVYFDTEDNHDTSNPSNTPISQAQIGKDKLTKVTKAFCETIEKGGYYVGIYASSSWFKNRLILNDLEEYDKWVAQWSNNAPSGISYGMWQYFAQGTINGIGGGVDLDYAYKDYPSLMKEQGLNGYSKEEQPTEPQPIPEERELKIGDKVIINGDLYKSSDADIPSGTVSNKKTTITRYVDGAKHPYNTTGDLGWMDKSSITLQENGYDVDKIAREVIEGKWGNYPERKTLLEEAGYDYEEVQNRVNEMLS